jgi:hypothetical protein
MYGQNKMVDEYIASSIRKIPKIFKRMIPTLLLFLTLFCLPGCDMGRVPEKVEGLPNTFRRAPLQTTEKVLSVLVWDSEDTPAWLIMAVKPINLKDFRVQVGFVPEDFEQMIPPDNQKFTPVAGNRYFIVIATDVRNHNCAYVLQDWISWTAED